MTTLSKEDVVRWAREAGCNIITTPDDVIARYNDVRVTNMLGRFAEAARADLVAENERLKALSVTNIMVDVVPGDGSGLEVYAKSVDEVVNLLSELGEKAEDLESVRAQLIATWYALAAAEADNERLRILAGPILAEVMEIAVSNGANSVSMPDSYVELASIISVPRDDSALREMIAGVYEECAKGCRKEAVVIVVDGPEERAYNNAISDCELAIRALAEKAKGK